MVAAALVGGAVVPAVGLAAAVAPSRIRYTERVAVAAPAAEVCVPADRPAGRPDGLVGLAGGHQQHLPGGRAGRGGRRPAGVPVGRAAGGRAGNKKRPTEFKTGLLLPYFRNVHERVKP
jgi:hypothetical protein